MRSRKDNIHIRRMVCGTVYESAYFTVEASLILPMALLFITMMIFLAFYSYDRCVMEQSAYEAALRGTSNHFDSAKEAYQAAETAAGRLVGDKLFAMRDFTYSVSVTADRVIVSYNGVVNVPLITWLSTYVEDLDFSLSVSREAIRCKQTKTIRGYRVINKTVMR